jgi:hypothetical protein
MSKITEKQLEELFKFYKITKETANDFFKNIGKDSISEILEILL